jgi:hypothetical protein
VQFLGCRTGRYNVCDPWSFAFPVVAAWIDTVCDTAKMSVSALNNGVFDSANTSNGVAIQSDLGFAFMFPMQLCLQ